MDALAHLERLVAINSFTQNRDGVLACGEYCRTMFEPLGFESELVRSVLEPCGDHLFLHRAGGVPLVLVGHLDTVYPPGTEFAWRDEGERVHGPGVADIKGGIVVLWDALRRLPELDRFDLRIFLNASEEGGCPDFSKLARDRVRDDTRACLVFEPGYDLGDGSTSVVTARKGSGRFHVDVHGREAHSGNEHDKGANALRELARFIETVESWTDYESDVTWTVGTAQGGTAANCVPGHAQCSVDMRVWTPEAMGEGRKRLMALAGDGSVQSGDGKSRCRIEIREIPAYPPWPRNNASDKLAAQVSALGETLGQPIRPLERRGGSDGAFLWDLAPTIDGLGVIGRDMHCSVHDPDTGREQESIEKASLARRANLAVALFESLA